jgi:hypothetical protein
LRFECEKYQALIQLKQSKKIDRRVALKRAGEGPKANQALWAALVLRTPEPLPVPERIRLALSLAEGWNELDSLQQFATVPELNTGLPAAFARVRRELPAAFVLKPSATSISRRVKTLETFELAAGSAIKLPWARVRVAVLSEIAQAYLMFSRELSALAPPKGISAEELAEYKKSIAEINTPFEEKGKTLMTKALEIGGELAINPEGIDGLAETVAAGQRAPASMLPMKLKPVELGLLDNLEGKTWSNLVVNVQPTPQENLRALWVDALRRKAWGRLAYFAQEYQRQAESGSNVAEMMRAVALYAVGAQAESLDVLQTVSGRLTGDTRERVEEVLLSNYQRTLGSKKVEALSKEIRNAWMSRALKGGDQ